MILGLFVVAACNLPQPPAPTVVPVDAPAVDVQRKVAHFPVRATTFDEARDSLRRVGSAVYLSGDDEEGDIAGQTHWDIDWSYRLRAVDGGGCELAKLTVQAEVVELLPEWKPADDVAEQEKAWWTAYVDFVTAHEARHGQIGVEGAEWLRTEALALGPDPDCRALEGRLSMLKQQATEQTRGNQSAFDAVQGRVPYALSHPSFELPVSDKPIRWNAERERLTVAYMREHYGRDASTADIEPRVVVLHWTAGTTLSNGFNTFNPVTLPSARTDIGTDAQVNVSAHFLVDRDGRVYRLMPETKMARHVIGLNAVSIGIENIGNGTSHPLTPEQEVANALLIRQLAGRHDLTHVIGHHEYTAFEGHPYFEELDDDYRTVKIDPGEEFVAGVLMELADLGLERAPQTHDKP